MARLEMDRDSCDIVFVVGSDEARVSCHSALFSVRCSKFVDIVSSSPNQNLTSQNQGLLTVDLNYVSSDGFIKFVHFIYTGQLDLAQGSVSPYDIAAIASIFGVESLSRFCVNYVSNTLTPRLAEKYLNDAAAISDLVPNKMSIIKPLLHWVGDNIATLRERNLLSNLEKPALIILVKSGLLC